MSIIGAFLSDAKWKISTDLARGFVYFGILLIAIAVFLAIWRYSHHHNEFEEMPNRNTSIQRYL